MLRIIYVKIKTYTYRKQSKQIPSCRTALCMWECVCILRSVFIDLRNSIRRSNANIFNTNITGVRYESDEASQRDGEIPRGKCVQSSQYKQLTMTKTWFRK